MSVACASRSRRLGRHPYIAVADHYDATLLSLEAQLPDHGGAQLWITEVGAFDRRRASCSANPGRPLTPTICCTR